MNFFSQKKQYKMTENTLLNVGEIAKLLSTSERFILDKIRENRLTAFLVGKGYVCFYSDVLAFVRSCPTAKINEPNAPLETVTPTKKQKK